MKQTYLWVPINGPGSILSLFASVILKKLRSIPNSLTRRTRKKMAWYVDTELPSVFETKCGGLNLVVNVYATAYSVKSNTCYNYLHK